MADFLFEIGLEEVPARMIAGAQAELLRRVTSMLCLQNLMASSDVASAKSYSTPRRLAIYAPGVFERQVDSFAKVVGPSVKIAYKDGQPTPAAESFARKNGLTVSDLKIESTDKGEYLVAEIATKGRSAAEVIAAELPKEIAGIYWAKTMYWRAGKPERFVRPVLWMVCLLDEEIVPVSFGGKTAGRASFGHRVLSSGEAFEIQTPGSYVAQSMGEYVLVDVEERRHRIRRALDWVTRDVGEREVAGARWREDEALVDAVTHLTEWPDVLLGNFDATYLELPEEVLVTVMRDHQKYFAVQDAQGKLAAHFLTVTNIALDAENAGIIRQGNERVLKARFNDARFFWEFDQRTPLVERVKLLENVTFQKDLGSYAKKSERVSLLAGALAEVVQTRGGAVDLKALTDAARLAKADLTTELVKEFTELQGQIGGLYARKEGFAAATWHAIYDQYLPASAKDAIPRSAEGAVLGLADRIDTIAGMFALGMEPTGSKDPFALRRAANAVVRILAESGLPLKLSDVMRVVDAKPEVAAKMSAFFAERIEFYLREGRGQAYDVAKAVMAAGADDIADLAARAEAVTSVRGGEDFLAVSAAFKRMKNILVQAEERGDSLTRPTIALAVPMSLEVLADASQKVKQEIDILQQEHKYVEALQRIATLRPLVDDVFENVMILDSNPAVRSFNLASLLEVVQYTRGVADLSEIVTAG